VTGATLGYGPGQSFNQVVPASVVKEVEAMEADFASGTLKVVPTEHDARPGS
jgi:simple sugar transport system substrate-binding protein/basic membrane protein A